jgi:CspA family cold shock protein
MKTGTVKWFNGKKGFGFIDGSEGFDYFVHFSSIVGDGFKNLHEGDSVNFDVKQTDKGMNAINVTKITK